MALKIKQIEYNKDKDLIFKMCKDHYVYHIKTDVNNKVEGAEDVDDMKIGDLHDAIDQDDIFFTLEVDRC